MSGLASYIIASKLKFIKQKIKTWNRDVFGNIKVQKHKLMGIINSLDVKEKSSGLISDEFQQKTVAKAEWAKDYLDGGNLLETKVEGSMALKRGS